MHIKSGSRIQLLHRISMAVCLLAAAALPLLLRPITEARRHLADGIELRQQGKIDASLVEFRGAVSWRSPWNSAAVEASQILKTLAATNSDKTVAIKASEELWRGLQSSRSWYLTIPGLWGGVTEHEAQELLFSSNPPPSNQLQEVHQPKVHFFWQMVAQCAFLTWLISVVFFLKRNFSVDGRFVWKSTKECSIRIGLLFLSWGLWIFALRRA